MRIHRVAFSNLNSLRGSHEVDFVNGPLASSGIFAITGPTGAGKSTILDAITLALFGRAARYDSTPSPTDMMSRGAGESMAEVEFEIDRKVYRASWSLTRARKKSDGAFQQAKRFVYDAQGKELASKTKTCSDLIESLIGLDADRFFRSVMLAQGEFAKFLRAKEDERAALLESLTNTSIYSQISESAFRRFKDSETELAKKEAGLAAIELLSDEAIAAEEAEVAALSKSQDEQTQQLAALNLRMNRLRSIDKLQSEIAALQRVQIDLNGQEQALAPKFALLARAESAAVFQSELTHTQRLQEELRQQDIQLGKLESDLTSTKAQLETSVQQMRAWTALQKKSLDDRQNALQQELEQLTHDAATVQTWLAEHDSLASIEMRLPTLVQLATELQLEQRVSTGLLEQIDSLNRESIESEQVQIDAQKRLEIAIANAEAASKKVRMATEAMTREFGSQTWQAMLDELQSLRQQSIRLIEAQTAAESQLQLKGELEKLEKSAADTNLRAAELEISLDKIDETLGLQRATVVALETVARQSALIKSLEQHRSQLLSEHACPLCGSLEHPFATDDAGLPDEDEQATKLKSAKKQLENLLDQQRGLSLLQQSTRDKATTINDSLKLTRNKLEQQDQLVCEIARELSIEEPITLANISAVGTTMHERIAALEVRQKQRIDAEQTMSQLTKADDACQNELSNSKTSLESISQTRKKNAKKQSELDEKILRSKTRCEETQAAFCATAADWTGIDSTNNDVAMMLAKLQQELQTFQEHRKELENISKLKDRATQSVRDLQSQFHSLAKVDLRLTSNSLLEQDAAPEQVDLKDCDSVARELDRLEKVLSEARLRFELQQKTTFEAQRKFDSSHAALSDRLLETAFESIDDLQAAILDDAVRADLKAAHQRLQQSLQDNATLQKAKVSELQPLLDAIAVEQTLPADEVQTLADLESNAAELNSRIDGLKDMASRIRERLDMDQVNRAKQQSGREHLAAERAKLETRRLLSQLIGGADGKPFRRFAQGLVLDYLIQNANVHLERFNDRYVLQRADAGSLDLSICDLHQADAVRPMASLSGGESFLVSLALALGLSELSGSSVQIDSLFIDEGFGTLDPDTLDVAIAALESLRAANKTIGIISHVELLKERIRAKIVVRKLHGGCSTLEIVG